MSDEDWGAGFAKSLGVFLNGDEIPNVDAAGRRVLDESFYLIFNAHWEPVEFVLPPETWGHSWSRVLDTRRCQRRRRTPGSAPREPGSTLIREVWW